MKSPFSFIVKPINNRRYSNVKNIGGVDFITSTSEEDHTVSNRYAEVVETPINYTGEVEVGDTLLVHHNVFKFYNDMYGRRKSGKSFFKDDLFFIDPDQFFLFKRNGKWKGYHKYCFVKPSSAKDSFVKKSGVIEPLMGVLKYSNAQLEKLGLKVGDEISYQPESEYEFNVDGELLYRMFTNNITLKLNG
jgi:hypothetical protein|tara:strand:+ start:3403 stop:3972 length:570 start_codon:yes stop_codon:yes gene_type:complete